MTTNLSYDEAKALVDLALFQFSSGDPAERYLDEFGDAHTPTELQTYRHESIPAILIKHVMEQPLHLVPKTTRSTKGD